MPRYHPKKTAASNALTDLIRAVLRMSANAQKAGTKLTKGMGLTNARWQTLGELYALEGRVTISQLARHVGLTRQAVQRLADAMASDGLVQFVANPADQRAMHVVLTERGAATYQDSLEREWQYTNMIADGLDAGEIERAVRTVGAISKRMEDDA